MRYLVIFEIMELGYSFTLINFNIGWTDQAQIFSGSEMEFKEFKPRFKSAKIRQNPV